MFDLICGPSLFGEGPHCVVIELAKRRAWPAGSASEEFPHRCTSCRVGGRFPRVKLILSLDINGLVGKSFSLELSTALPLPCLLYTSDAADE